jgi:F0F1-type ATP synthase membrane subunit b/b'
VFLSLDGTAVVQLLNFAIFFALMSVVFFKPVRAAVARRRAHINQLAAESKRCLGEAKTLRNEAEAVRACARRDGEHHIAAVRGETSNETARIAAEYSRRAARIVDAAHLAVADGEQSARYNENVVVRELADRLLDRILSALSVVPPL